MGWMAEKGTRGLIRHEPTMGSLEAAIKLKLCSQPARPGLAWLFANQVTWQVQWVPIIQAPVLGSGSAMMMGQTLPSWSSPCSGETEPDKVTR